MVAISNYNVDYAKFFKLEIHARAVGGTCLDLKDLKRSCCSFELLLVTNPKILF